MKDIIRRLEEAEEGMRQLKPEPPAYTAEEMLAFMLGSVNIRCEPSSSPVSLNERRNAKQIETELREMFGDPDEDEQPNGEPYLSPLPQP